MAYRPKFLAVRDLRAAFEKNIKNCGFSRKFEGVCVFEFEKCVAIILLINYIFYI